MKQQTVVVLVLAAAALAGGAYLVSRSSRPGPGSEGAPPSSVLFPDLRDKAGDVATIVVTRSTGETTIARKDGAWVLADKADYPVQVSHVTRLVGGLADLRPVEKKTSSPDLYAKLGVQDVTPPTPDAAPVAPDSPPGSPPAEGTPARVTLKNQKGESLLSVIVGNSKWGVDGNSSTPGVYVRKAGDAQSWLARPGPAAASSALDVPQEALGWIDRTAVNIPRDRIRTATVTRPGAAPVVVARDTKEDRAFRVEAIPEGRELSSPSAGDMLAGAPGYVTVDDILAAADAAFVSGPEATVAEFRTFDGLVLTARSMTKDGKSYISFAASVDEAVLAAPADAAAPPAEGAPPVPPPPQAEKKPEEVRKEAEELNRKTAAWVFLVPEYKAKAFQTSLEELLKPLPATPLLEPGEPAGPSPQSPAGAPPAPIQRP